jgi:hypothetical protein
MSSESFIVFIVIIFVFVDIRLLSSPFSAMLATELVFHEEYTIVTNESET